MNQEQNFTAKAAKSAKKIQELLALLAAFAVKIFLVLVCPGQDAADISGLNPLR